MLTRACCALLVLLASLSYGQSTKRPLAVADLERLLRAGVTPHRASVLVDERGISFDLTPAIKGQLRAAGADDDLIAALERAAAQARSRPRDEKPKQIEAARPSAEPPKEPEPSGEANGKPAMTALVIRSNVSGDTVLIDGVEVGPSSSRPRPVTPGIHTVELRKDGVPSETKRVDVLEGETAQVRFTLRPPPKPVVTTLAAPEMVDASAPAGMVSISGGPFFMGCDEATDSECRSDEKPGQMVDVASFRIDKTEVTVAAFGQCVSAQSCAVPDNDRDSCNWPKRPDHPMNCVSWVQAVAYCTWAGKRLPSDAEWEKAARGSDHRKYAWGNSGFTTGNKVANIEGEGDGFAATSPVGSFPAGRSPSGALDMIGNVWEWTADLRGGHPAVRGGAWNYGPRDARVTARIYGTSTREYAHVGFRCVQ